MKKYTFNDYFVAPEGKIAKRMLFKSDDVIAFVLNIAKDEICLGILIWNPPFSSR